MSKDLKNSFSTDIYSPTQRILRFGVILFLIVLGTLLPFFQAQAFSLISLGERAAKTILNIFVGGIFQLIAFIGNAILVSAAALLGRIMGGLTPLSYTKPAGNPIIDIGWTLVRDLANMGIIIVLVIIALGTALRISGYQAKKTLPTLILIALLINFTPVICGLVVDAGNIVMNFFVKDLTGWNTFVRIYRSQWDTIEKGLVDQPVWEDLTFLGASMGLAAFAWLGAAILLIYAILFAMRYVAIWILVILSPLAFFFYILPATRKVFSQWWNQFVQWTFIGAIAGFFLYLSHHILYLISRPVSKGGIDLTPEGAEGVIGGLFPYFVVIVFLYIGFFVALSTSAMGASGVVAGAQRIARGAPGWIAKTRPVQRALGKAAGRVAKGLTGAERGIRRLEAKTAERGPGGKILSYTLKPLRWAVSPAKLAAPPLMRYAATKRKVSIPKEFDTMSPLEQQRYVEAQLGLSKEDRLQFASYMAEKGTLKAATKEFIDKSIGEAEELASNPNYQKEISSIYKSFPERMTTKTKIKMATAFKVTRAEKEKAKKAAEEEITKLADEISNEAKINPKLETEITTKITPAYRREDVIKDMAAAQLYVKTLKPKDIAAVVNPKSTAFIRGIVNFGNTPQVSAAGREHGKVFIDAYMEEADRKGYEWFKKNKPEVLTYLSKNSAQELGFRAPRKTPPSSVPPEARKKEIPPKSPLRGRPGVTRGRPPRGRIGH